jgi:hypothetical protein
MDDEPRPLEGLIAELRTCAPDKRIDLREAFLAHGDACVEPLLELALDDGGFVASVASWLEVLAKRDPATKAHVVDGLVALAQTMDGHYAREALARLNGTARLVRSLQDESVMRSDAEARVHAEIIQAAREGRTVFYSDLHTSRGHIGRYLLHISQDEARQGHPPLTSIVISRTTGRPGDGFLPAMLEVGFAKPGEPLDVVWRRAVDEVHAFWRNR